MSSTEGSDAGWFALYSGTMARARTIDASVVGSDMLTASQYTNKKFHERFLQAQAGNARFAASLKQTMSTFERSLPASVVTMLKQPGATAVPHHTKPNRACIKARFKSKSKDKHQPNRAKVKRVTWINTPIPAKKACSQLCAYAWLLKSTNTASYRRLVRNHRDVDALTDALLERGTRLAAAVEDME